MLPLKVFVIRMLTIFLIKKFNNVAVLLHSDNQSDNYYWCIMKKSSFLHTSENYFIFVQTKKGHQ